MSPEEILKLRIDEFILLDEICVKIVKIEEEYITVQYIIDLEKDSDRLDHN